MCLEASVFMNVFGGWVVSVMDTSLSTDCVQTRKKKQVEAKSELKYKGWKEKRKDEKKKEC